MLEIPVVDGFTYSASQLMLPNSYRASALAQMEVLRRARGYRTRWYIVPEDSDLPIPARSQIEYQVSVQAGSYVWGLSFTAPFNEVVDLDSFYVQITDNCTETPFFSDYVRSQQLAPGSTGNVRRAPVLITPRIIGEPAMLNVEVYNSLATETIVQLLILVAEPSVPPGNMLDILVQAGIEGRG